MKRTLLTLGALLLATTVHAQDLGGLLNDLRAIRAQYPASMSREQAAEMLNTFAYAHPGWGMLQKGSGNSCPIHGVYVSCDILINHETIIHYDVAMGADFDGQPNMNPIVFNSVGPCVIGPSSGCAMDHFQAPFTPSGGPVVTSPAIPTPPPANPSFEAAVRSFIEDVRAAIGRIETRQVAGEQWQADFDARTSAALAARPTTPTTGITFPVYKGSLFGAGITLTPQK